MSTKSKLFECESDESYCKFGVDRLTKLLEDFESQIGGVAQSDDIEYVHKMRVASRRIRATMPLFSNCFPQKKFKRWLKQVKGVTRLLGDARDLDVQIAFLEQYQAKNKASAKGPTIEPLLKSHENRRARIQPNVVKGLKKLQNSNLLMEMQDFFNRIVKDLKDLHFDSSSLMEKAFWATSGKLDDFLAMEQYVHQENEVRKLHEMRIQAKWLRYTMETFASLYQNKLTKEIEAIKTFQDTLGEMHDCDVWIEYVPEFIKKNTKLDKKSEQALLKFLEYVKGERKKHYTSFVETYEDCKKKDFFEKLRETTNCGFPKAEDKIKELQTNPKPEVAIISDIHGNLHALQAVIEDAEKRGINTFLNAGDLIGFGPFPSEVIEVTRSNNVISVVGNFDVEVLENVKKEEKESKIALEFARTEVSGSCRTYLSSLPHCVELEISGKKVLLTHGSPESIDEHLYSDTSTERFKTVAEDTKVDIIITGHSHEQYCKEVSKVFFVNPGSVGRPADKNPQAAYAIAKFNPFSVELLRVDYDVAAAAKALRKKGLPESFSQMLLCGVAIDEITKEDHKRKTEMNRDCQKAVKNCEKISEQYEQDKEHYEQVRRLSLCLFDQLQALHRLGSVERCWLECASILHDIGILETTKAHNKKSMELILNDTRLLLPSEERRIIASMARYHRKGFPKKKHYNLVSLSPKTIKKITLLSGILRVADSLDYTHNRIVENLTVRIGAKKTTIECTANSNPTLEKQAFSKKKDLIEKALKNKMVLAWKQR